MTTRAAAMAFLVAATATLLTGCGPTGLPTSSPDTSTSSSATPTESVGATPSAAPTATTPSAPVAASCENLVSAASLADFSSRGLTITPPAAFSTKLHDEGSPLAGFFDAGGLLCQLGNGSESPEMYGWAPFAEAYAIPIQSSLAGEGWTVSATGGGALYSLAADADNNIHRCLFTDTEMICAETDARLAEVQSNAP